MPKRLFVEAVHDDYEGFRILLRGDAATDRMLRVSFEMPLLYRKTDEGDRLKTVHENPAITQSALFTVEQSTLVEWLASESDGMRGTDKMTHFLFACSNDVLEVISEFKPHVEWL